VRLSTSRTSETLWVQTDRDIRSCQLRALEARGHMATCGLLPRGGVTKQAPARDSPARQTSGHDVVVYLHVGDLVARGAASRRMPQRSSSPLVRLPGDQHLTRLLTPEGTKTLGIRRKQLGEALFDETVCARVVVRRQPLPLQR
jgi:hypothetical protein